ncbi:hypothetical protein ABKV19_024675 [Rosa sericea]
MALQTQESGKISLLNDDLLGLILTRVKVKGDRKSCSEVCKQWLRVEGLRHSSLVVLQRHDFVISALTRFPNLTKFETWKPMTDTDLEFLAKACPQLKITKFSWRQEDGDGGAMSEKGLRALGNGCPKLAGVWVSGEGRVGDSGVGVLVHCAANLKCLCLGGNSLISDEALEAIGSASSCSIGILKLVDCCNITDRGLGFLANGNTSQTLKKLILVRCDRITDTGIVLLSSKMCSLELLELSLGAKQRFTDIAGVAISAIQTLKVLNLDGRWDVSNRTIFALGENCRNLRKIRFKGFSRVNVTWDALSAIRGPYLTSIDLEGGDI